MKHIIHKYKKSQKVQVSFSCKDYKRLDLLYGFVGLKAMGTGRLRGGQLESMRRTVKKNLKKEGTLWLRLVLDRPLTAKPSEVRMGKGKGNFSENISIVKIGTILLEIGGKAFNEGKAIAALNQLQKKLPFPTKIIFYHQ